MKSAGPATKPPTAPANLEKVPAMTSGRVRHVEMVRQAVPALPEHAEAVGLVDEEERAVLVLQRVQLFQVGPVAVHAVDRINE